MPRRDPADAAGLVVIRLWVESEEGGASKNALRARVTTARDPDLGTEDTFTVAGLDAVLKVVREFLVELVPGPVPSPEPRPGETLL
jgi:hypothetical protein